MRHVAIIGSEGAQGKRYQAILRYLGYSPLRIDLGLSLPDKNLILRAKGVIVATPTETHLPYVKRFIGLNLPILVEKPFCKDLFSLRATRRAAEKAGADVSMVMQYRHLVDTKGKSDRSYYNYFRHGNDGLTWDCLQIIGLAKGHVSLFDTSPTWDCVINGEKLNIADMDYAYVKEVETWLNGYRLGWDRIIAIHEKVAALAGDAHD